MGASLASKAKGKKRKKQTKPKAGETKAGKMKAGKTKATGPGHQQLDPEFAYVGKRMAILAKKSLPTSLSVKDPHANSIGKIFRDHSVVLSKQRFGRKYRAVQKYQDELVSTSSMRELLAGAISAKGGHSQELEDAIVKISKVRFPTWATGFSLKDKFMQHPSRSSQSLFGDFKASAALHAELDLKRKQEVAEAMKAETAKPKPTADSIANAGIRTAVGFTLNVFAAPASARDVRPYLKGKNISPDRIEEQVRARETLKEILVKAGGVQETSNLTPAERYDNPWSDRSSLRSASPSRARRRRSKK